jgi:hypothetical protein
MNSRLELRRLEWSSDGTDFASTVADTGPCMNVPPRAISRPSIGAQKGFLTEASSDGDAENVNRRIHLSTTACRVASAHPGQIPGRQASVRIIGTDIPVIVLADVGRQLGWLVNCTVHGFGAPALATGRVEVRRTQARPTGRRAVERAIANRRSKGVLA